MGPFAVVKQGSENRLQGSWYQDEAWFLNRNFPWFRRGGYYYMGTGSGLFSFYHEHGSSLNWFTYRLVLKV